MLIKLVLDDFKSFRRAELELSRLTLLVGANASGKSNVFDAIRFLQGLALGMSPADVLRGRWEGGREVWPPIRGGVGEVTRYGERQLRLRSHWSLESVFYRHEIAYTTNPPLGITVENASRGDEAPIHSGNDRSMFAYVEKDSALAPLVTALRGAFFLDINPRRMRDYVSKTQTQLGAEGHHHAPTARRSARPQPRNPTTASTNWNRCVPVRQTRGIAANAAATAMAMIANGIERSRCAMRA